MKLLNETSNISIDIPDQTIYFINDMQQNKKWGMVAIYYKHGKIVRTIREEGVNEKRTVDLEK